MSENETMINDEIPSFTTSEPKVTDTEKYTYNYSQSNKIHLAGPVEQAVIDYTNVIKMKNLCNTAKKKHFPWAELFLGIASLLLGAALSAWISGVKYEFAVKPILFYTVCPMFGSASAVAWFFVRKNETAGSEKLAERFEEYLPIIEKNTKGE